MQIMPEISDDVYAELERQAAEADAEAENG